VDPTTKGNTTAAPLLRGRPPSGPASTAFERQSQRAPPVRFLPSPRLGLAFWLSQSRILAAVLGPCESLGRRGYPAPKQGFGFKSIRLLLLEASGIGHIPTRIVVRDHLELGRYPCLLLPALVVAADGLELPSVSLPITRSPLFALLRY
jgi:hypothetical protein